ncbi:MAG: TIGR02301 family protein [Rhodomicrobium sp.]|nr:TIGR02301 family protein [Rhodomicrobium sp.]
MTLGRQAKPAIFAAALTVVIAAATVSAQAQAAAAAQKQPSAPALAKPAGPDDRPYDAQLFRLAEILGTLHYLRELCGANEGQTWREQMRELVNSEGTSALRRAKLVESFNRGYRDYSRTYRACTTPALVAIQRFMEQASAISDAIIANDK